MSVTIATISSCHCAKPAGDLRRPGLLGDRRYARVDRQAEGDDALGGEVGETLRVRDDAVEQFVDGDEVGAAHVPVRLLAVDGEQAEDDGSEELRRARRGLGPVAVIEMVCVLVIALLHSTGRGG